MARPDGHLAELVRHRRRVVEASASRRRRKRPPAIVPPNGLVQEYGRELKRLVAGFWDLALGILEPALPRLLEVAVLPHVDGGEAAARLRADLAAGRCVWPPDASELRLDASPAGVLIGKLVNDIAVAYGIRFPPEKAEQLAFDFAKKTSAYNRAQVNRQFRAVLGIDLPASDTNLGPQLDLFRKQNVSLITKLSREALDKIETILVSRSRQGTRVEDLRRELMETQGFTKSRAALIARDQVLKLNGELTQLRHREAGVEEYEWSTSGDERVRDRHAALNGTVHRWDDPPVVDEKGRRCHPGEDYQCRCTAIPVIKL